MSVHANAKRLVGLDDAAQLIKHGFYHVVDRAALIELEYGHGRDALQKAPWIRPSVP